MRREFKAVVSLEDDIPSVMDGWLEWKEKLIQMAKLESATRPMIKKLLEGLERCDELHCPQGQHLLLLVII